MAKAATPTSTCAWCTKPMEAEANRCTSCGKLRKDIYTDKIKAYGFMISGGFVTGLGIALSKKKKAPDPNDFYNYFQAQQNTGSSGNSTGTIVIICGIITLLVGFYFYYRVSQRLKTWWWM